MFGEIDCREGILVAVEKLRYDDVDEGIRATVAVWMAAALRLVDEKALDAYVHPIIPVLNETRHIVRAYNAQLEAAVKAAAPRLAWLDGVFDELLTADGEHSGPSTRSTARTSTRATSTRRRPVARRGRARARRQLGARVGGVVVGGAFRGGVLSSRGLRGPGRRTRSFSAPEAARSARRAPPRDALLRARRASGPGVGTKTKGRREREEREERRRRERRERREKGEREERESEERAGDKPPHTHTHTHTQTKNATSTARLELATPRF